MNNQKINELIEAAENILASDVGKSAMHKCLEIELAMRIKDIKTQPVNDELDKLVWNIQCNFKDYPEELKTLRAIANGLMWSEETYDAIKKLASLIDRDINQSWNELPNQPKQKQIEPAF
jgi:hypothetical protein